MEADLANTQQKLEDNEEQQREEFDKYDSRTRELGDHVREQSTMIDSLNEKLDIVESLNAEASKLQGELSASLAVFEMVGNKKEDLEAQLEGIRKTLADFERSPEETAAADREELVRLQHELEAARGDLDDHVWENESLASTIAELKGHTNDANQEVASQLALVVKRFRGQALSSQS